MHNGSAIILAAGQSRRMGALNKLLLSVNGVPMVRHVVNQYRAAIDGQITIVVGHEADKVKEALEGTSTHCVFNPDHANGQQSSVACGLAHAPAAGLVLIGLGDQPLLRTADIRDLVAAHQDDTKISIPVSGDKRGNPIAVPHALRARLTADPARPGCMRFTRDHPEMVHRHRLPAEGFYADIDTPEDYAALLQKGPLSHEKTHHYSASHAQETGAHS